MTFPALTALWFHLGNNLCLEVPGEGSSELRVQHLHSVWQKSSKGKWCLPHLCTQFTLKIVRPHFYNSKSATETHFLNKHYHFGPILVQSLSSISPYSPLICHHLQCFLEFHVHRCSSTFWFAMNLLQTTQLFFSWNFFQIPQSSMQLMPKPFLFLILLHVH